MLQSGARRAATAGATCVKRFRYVTGEYHSPATYIALGEVLREVDAACGTGGNRIFYLATLPAVFPTIVEHLGGAGLNRPSGERQVRARRDREALRPRPQERRANSTGPCTSPSTSRSVYRIDHYLGKETVQNVLALRFANAIFEPIWNRRYIDNVQITVAETLGVGHRAGFYETAGALRDIVQNHVLQVLTLVAMEPPARVQPEEIRDEKVKVLQGHRRDDARRRRTTTPCAASTRPARSTATRSSATARKTAWPRTATPRPTSPPSS